MPKKKERIFFWRIDLEMSTYDDYLTNDDKPYAENINDALLVSNVFNLTVPIELPLMFRDGHFNTNTSARKAGVAIITFIEKDNDVTVNDNSISGTGDLTFKFYPNFNSYGRINILDWMVTSGSVTADIIAADNTTLLSGHTGGVISGAGFDLTKLQEFKIILHLNNATLTKINFVMANKEETRYGAECGISDVTGLQTSLDGKSDIGHTHVADDITELKSALLDLIYPIGSIYMSVEPTSPSTLFGGMWQSLQGRFLIGADSTYHGGSIGGEAQHKLTRDEMPSHTHTQNSHNHTQNSHNHTQNSHNHTQNAHSHNPYNNSKFIETNASTFSTGTQKRNASTNNDGNYYWQTNQSNQPTAYMGSATKAATATNQAATATNNSATATNQATTATNNNTGGGQGHNNMPPYRAVYMWKRTT